MTVELEISLTDEELVDEVRKALAGLDASKIPDDTIIQTAERFVTPLLNDVAKNLEESDQSAFDNAAIAWTAELSFGAWLTFTRLRDREIETYIDASQYRSQLEQRTNMALRQVDGSRPPEIPNEVVTVKHDGVNRKIDLHKFWVQQ